MATVTKSDSISLLEATEGVSLWKPLKALGSLKLTVALFAISLVLVLVGTLAQDEMNMQDVKSRYFVSWIAWTYFDDFFPQAFYPHENKIPGVLPIPGGALVGVLLMLNLVAAKITRFKMNAKGGKLLAGIGFLIAGFVVACLIIASGHSSDGLQGTPPIAYPQLWGLIMGGLSMLSVGALASAFKARSMWSRAGLVIAGLVMFGFIVFAVATGYRIGDPGLRIVWQLTKGIGAGLVLLIGCQLLFEKQGGNVLLHLGVMLLMVGQFAFGDRQLEQRLS
ncbi:MAG: cytochrome C biogenesis protein, partial [Planctomycetota bacterium]